MMPAITPSSTETHLLVAAWLEATEGAGGATGEAELSPNSVFTGTSTAAGRVSSGFFIKLLTSAVARTVIAFEQSRGEIFSSLRALKERFNP